MIDKHILEENGWIVECESPFEIKHEDGSFATMNAAYMIVDYLYTSNFIDDIVLIKNSYKANLIYKETFVNKIIELIEK